ncbi:MAG TPA: response regulator transcription factor [Ohtaekwangia sp.]|nr:response regulator transcription factor [Ohtaekwangia sp.]
MIKIAVADDHSLFRVGIVNMLQASGNVMVIAEAASIQETRSLLDAHPDIDVLLCDINFPDGDGFEILQFIKTFNKATKVLFLSMHDKSSYATKAIDCGAYGYLTKDTAREELISGLLAVASGKKYLGQNIMANIVENMNKPRQGHNFFRNVLSKRELEVLEMIIEGLDTNEIADKLFISEKTAANYRVSIMRKCDVKNVVQLIKLYLQHA